MDSASDTDRLAVAQERVERVLKLAGGQGWTVEVDKTPEGCADDSDLEGW